MIVLASVRELRVKGESRILKRDRVVKRGRYDDTHGRNERERRKGPRDFCNGLGLGLNSDDDHGHDGFEGLTEDWEDTALRNWS